MGETHVHPWLIHVDVWQKSPQYCKVISLQLKLIIIKKKTTQNSPQFEQERNLLKDVRWLRESP